MILYRAVGGNMINKDLLKIEKIEKLKEKEKKEHKEMRFSAFAAGWEGALAIKSAIETANIKVDSTSDIIRLIICIICTGIIGAFSVKNVGDMLLSIHKQNKLNDKINELNEEIDWRK